MAYRGDHVDISQMSDELMAAGRTSRAALIELANAFSDGAIRLRFASEPVVHELPDIIKFLKDFAAGVHKAEGWGSARWWTVCQGAQASRGEFETACGLATSADKPSRKGPTPGTVDRYGDSDRARFPEIVRLMMEGKSLTAATDELGPTLEGAGTSPSKAKRLRDAFNKFKAQN